MVNLGIVIFVIGFFVVLWLVFFFLGKNQKQESIRRALSSIQDSFIEEKDQLTKKQQAKIEQDKEREEEQVSEVNIRGVVVRTTIIICIISFIVLNMFGTSHNTLIKLGVGLLLIIFMRVREVCSKMKERDEIVEEKLPEALEIISRCMNAGQTLSEALGYAAHYAHPIIARELVAVTRLVSLGVTLHEAALQSARRLRIDAFGAFMVVLMIHERAGGNLVDILSNMAELFRQQRFLRIRIAELTSEGRVNAYVMVLTPMGLLGLLYVLSPQFVEPLFTTDVGQMILAGAIVFELIAVVIIYRILSFSKL